MGRMIAIDLGAYAVKVSEFNLAGRRLELVGRYALQVPQDAGELPSTEVRLEVLDDLIEQHPTWQGGGTEVVASWPAERSTLHRLRLPFSDKTKVVQALPFALEAEVPFDLEDMVLGWRVARGTEEGTDAVALLTREEPLAEWIDALASRGLDPARIIVDGDLAGYWTSSECTSALLDIGHTHTVISVVQGGRVVQCRAANVGGHTFTRAIQQALGCSWAEAEALKHGEPTHPDEEPTDGGRVSEPTLGSNSGYARLPPEAKAAMDGAIGLLLAEVRATLIATEDLLGVGIDELKLTGGGARVSEIWDYLAQDLGLPVSRATEPEGGPVPGPFAVSHALAKQFAGATHGDEIDLRVGDLAYQGGGSVLRAALLYGGAGLTFFAFAATLMFVFRFYTLYTELSEVTGQSQAIVAETWGELSKAEKDSSDRMMSKVRMETADAVARAEALEGSASAEPPLTTLLLDLHQAMPPHPSVRIDVDQLTIDQATVKFNGVTNGFASSASIEETLQKTERFKNAVKSDEQKTSKGVKFTITVPLQAEEEAG